jgi:predicted O-methyltransferase YrrM
MDGITDEQVEKYVYEILPDSPSILREMETIAKARRIPIVGPMIGRILYILASVSNARHVLEVGTAIGYSALWFGLAVKKTGGKVTTIEIDTSLAREALKNIRRARLTERIEVINGNGLDVVPKLQGKFNIIFIDDSKENYPRYLDLCAEKLCANGLLIADNTLWSGEVARKIRSAEALAIAEFNMRLMKKMLSVIIPARDGLAIGIK